MTLTVFFLVVVVVRNSLAVQTKPYRLIVLDFHDEGADGDYVQIAQIVTDTVNNRSDILPDYHIELQLVEENYGQDAAKAVVAFSRQSDAGYYKSPIVIGPEFSGGGSAVGNIAHHLGIISLASTCGATSLANHRRYPNLYLMIETSQFTGLAMLHFMRKIGWSQFALLSNAANVNDYGGAMLIYKAATENGFTVSWFSMIRRLEELDDLVLSLKVNDARVFVIFTGTNTIFYQFLCLAHHAGMTGPHYTFISTFFAISEPFDLTDDDYTACSRSVIYTQLQQTFFVGQAQNVQNPTAVSQLGHTQTQFTSLLLKYTKETIPSDEPYRYTFYDAHVITYVALHNAEEQLKTMNLSLRDYASFPDIVADVVSTSLLNVNVSGLHKKEMTYNKVDGQPDGEGHAVAQWSPTKGLQSFAVAGQLHQNNTNPSYSNYFIRIFREIDWKIHPNRKQPKDGVSKEVEHLRVSKGVFAAVTVIAIVLIALKVAWLCASVWAKKIEMANVFSQILNDFGCALINVSAICFAYHEANEGSWIAGITLLSTGLAISNGGMVVTATLWYLIPAQSRSASAATSKRSTTRIVRGSQQHREESRHGSKIARPIVKPKDCNFSLVRGVICFVAVNSVVLIAWFIADPINCSWQSVGGMIYDPIRDVLRERLMNLCSSQNFKAWALALTFWHMASLLAGNWVAYVVKHHLHDGHSTEFAYVRLGLANASTFLLGGLLVIVVLRKLVAQQSAIAFIALLYSASTATINILSAFKSIPLDQVAVQPAAPRSNHSH